MFMAIIPYRMATTMLAGVALTACASNALNLASSAPDQPWAPKPGDSVALHILRPPSRDAAASRVDGPDDFGIPADVKLAYISESVAIDANRAYGLADLIDIAQRSNPSTRISWERARQAALSVGMAEATYLPLITASAIGGIQNTTTPLPESPGDVRSFDTTLKGASPSIALQWLVFDFGQREALVDAARQNAFAANVVFNGAHQQLIFDVTRAYYQYGAAVEALRIARQALSNSRAVQEAAEQRLAKGLATTVEVAQARQQTVQSELRRVTAEGQMRDAYQTLLAAMGVTATLKVKIDGIGKWRLPASLDRSIEPMIGLALSRRPDVVASYATVKASKSGVVAAKAEFLPKVFISAAVATGTSGFSADGLPTISDQTTSTGVLVGASVPLYDGGLRAARLKRAESQLAAAEQSFRKTQMDAATEIVVASNTLRTALESYRTASDLTAAAAVTYDAALDAYKDGLGTVTAATEADSDLLDARLTQAQAQAASLIAAANLAFVIGALTSSESLQGASRL